MPEESIVAKSMTTREMVYGMPDMAWMPKIDLIRSQVGGYVNIAGGASGSITTQITQTDYMTGKGTLTSAGMKFYLKTLYVGHPSNTIATVTVLDGTTTAMVVLAHGSANAQPCMLNFECGRRFSSSVQFVAGGKCYIFAAGLRTVVMV